MSKEAIELLEEAKIHIAMIQTNSRKPELIGERTTILVGEKYKTNGGILDKALALLRAEESVLPPATGKRKKGHSKLVYDKKLRTIVAVDPNPEEPVEFTKNIRDAVENHYRDPLGFISYATRNLLEACDIIDRQVAEIKELKEKQG